MGGHCELKFEGCRGHLGRYGNCLTAALHQAASSMVSWADGEGGDVASPYGFRWLIVVKEQITIKAGDWDGGFDLHVASGQYFILVENDQGFVHLFSFDTEDEARADFEEFVNAYAEWDEVNGDE